MEIRDNVRLLSIKEVDDVSHYLFDSHIEEYNRFLAIADKFFDLNYGSFMLEMARAFAFDMNELGIACRFVTVDADIEYDSETPFFYEKNGFVENLSTKRKNPKHTISMRKDIFVDD